MTLVQRLLLSVLVLMPVAATAADLPVTYTVEEKRLKDALAGTPLTFELYRNNTCTAPVVHSAVILIQNVTLITKLKQFTPKNDVKLPKPVELRMSLPGVTAPGNLYLKVTGLGVIPVGGACQAQAAQVVAANCVDTVQNQNESDVDCGGANACPRCSDGDTCVGNSDCASSLCSTGICQVAPTCTDGIQNGDESDIDCGGSAGCPQCDAGETCVINQDCLGSNCMAGICQPSCSDGQQNAGESGVDCGGATACPRCGTGGGCLVASDCQSSVCMAGLCQAPVCGDGVKNGNETDVDCGGPNPMCPRCPPGDMCLGGGDCVSMMCSMMLICQ